MDERGLPDWDESVLEHGSPRLMNTPTLIEWIQRQLETESETKARHKQMGIVHKQWHEQNSGTIYACCIRVGVIKSRYATAMLSLYPSLFDESHEKR